MAGFEIGVFPTPMMPKDRESAWPQRPNTAAAPVRPLARTPGRPGKPLGLRKSRAKPRRPRSGGAEKGSLSSRFGASVAGIVPKQAAKGMTPPLPFRWNQFTAHVYS